MVWCGRRDNRRHAPQLHCLLLSQSRSTPANPSFCPQLPSTVTLLSGKCCTMRRTELPWADRPFVNTAGGFALVVLSNTALRTARNYCGRQFLAKSQFYRAATLADVVAGCTPVVVVRRDQPWGDQSHPASPLRPPRVWSGPSPPPGRALVLVLASPSAGTFTVSALGSADPFDRRVE